MSDGQPSAQVLEHRANGRSWTALIVIVCVWLVLIALWVIWDATPWIVLVLGAVTLPAVWDFVTARAAWMLLNDDRIQWRSGRQSGDVLLDRLDHVRFDTRLDLSVRVRLVLHGGKRISIPQDALPKPPALQDALDARGIKTERHHFSFM